MDTHKACVAALMNYDLTVLVQKGSLMSKHCVLKCISCHNPRFYFGICMVVQWLCWKSYKTTPYQ